MTEPTEHTRDIDTETEQCYRYEISGAMDQVIRYCHTAVNDHSHRGFWTPTGANPTSTDLINQARSAILTKLRMVLDCAEKVAAEIERDRQRHRDPNQGSE